VILAIALNIGIIAALIAGLGTDAVMQIVENIDVAVIEPPPDVDKPPPPPPPVEREPPPFVPPPDINIDITEAAPAPTAITNTSSVPTPAAPPSVATPPKGGNQNRVTRADYPPVSIRLNETGVVRVKVTLDATGAVQNVELVKSSGHSRLDEATLRLVRTKFRYTPAKDAAGNAIPAAMITNVTWNLN
jgi:protein TonB